VVLLFCLAAGGALLPDEDFEALGKHVASGAAFVSNFTLWFESGYFDSSAEFKPLLHLWSLGIEEQFYIFWPVLLFLAARWPRGTLALIAAVFAFSLGVSAYESPLHPVQAFYSPLSRFWELLAGGGLAYLALSGSPLASPARARSNTLSILGLGSLAAGFYFINSTRVFPGWWALLPVMGASALIWAGQRAWVNRFILSNCILVWFGLISFPLYLWHWPLLAFPRVIEGDEVAQATRVGLVLAAIALAWLTFWFIERPIRRGSAGAFRPMALAGAMSVTGLMGAAIYVAGDSDWRPFKPKVVNVGGIGHREFFEHINRTFFPCTPKEIYNEIDDWNGIVRCFQSKNQDRKTLALIGDSHAEHLFPGIAEQLASENVVFYGEGGLPFLGRKEYIHIFDYVLSDANIATVIIAANWDQKLKGLPLDDWMPELAATLRRLAASGKQAYLVADVPRFTFLPARCKFAGRLGIRNKCSELDSDSEPGYMGTFREIARLGGPDKPIVLRDLFCQRGKCAMAGGGQLYFRDLGHLTIAGSRFVSAPIAEQMKAH
jgi:peptidoglycan/LPS O-acetylase OafA/YrhL